MSHKILVAFFSLLLVLGTQTSAFAGTGKPHHRHVKKVKKVKKPHHRHHMR